MKQSPQEIKNDKEDIKSAKKLNIFDRYLSLWVFLCMATGILFGKNLPNLTDKLGHLEIAQVNLPVGILIWIMVIPMFISIDLKELHQVRHYWRGALITLLVNWLVKPFSMAFLAWLFLKHFFVAWLPSAEINNYIAGLIILAAAPCTAMVFVWSYLSNGEPHFTLSQVALNDILMIILFAPIVGLLLGITNLTVPFSILLWSVIIYILFPFIIAQVVRYTILKNKNVQVLMNFLKKIRPFSIISLLIMLILLFAFQGKQIISFPLIVLMLAVPIVIQVYFNSMLAYGLNYLVGEKFQVACPSALIGASNFFELAVAVAVSLFGLTSGATLATIVGVIVEVPVMLSVVSILKRTESKYYAHI